MLKFFIAIGLLISSLNVLAEVPLKVQKVTENVYAIIGELVQRSPENYANNATFGLVVTPKGAVLIDSGGSYLGAQQLHKAIQTVTDQPVKIVINAGGQDHRWLGNGYFKEKGARIISSKAALEDQTKRADDQFFMLNLLLKDKLKGTKKVYADETFEDSMTLDFGGEKFTLVHAGAAHTKGDIFIWMPSTKVMFSGDIVFTDRLLGPGPAADTASWLKVFEKMVSYKPDTIVPGHGTPSTIKKATAETYDYIAYMRKEVGKVLDNDGDMQDAVKIDQSKFSYLKVFDQMSGRAAQSFFSEMEFE